VGILLFIFVDMAGTAPASSYLCNIRLELVWSMCYMAI